MASVAVIIALVVLLFNVISCYPSFKPLNFREEVDQVKKRDMGQVQALVDENFPFDNNFEDQERLRHKLIQLLIYILENKNMDGKHETESEKMRKIREMVGSNLGNLNFLEKLDKIRSIGKPLKNEHRHVFIGK